MFDVNILLIDINYFISNIMGRGIQIIN